MRVDKFSNGFYLHSNFHHIKIVNTINNIYELVCVNEPSINTWFLGNVL